MDRTQRLLLSLSLLALLSPGARASDDDKEYFNVMDNLSLTPAERREYWGYFDSSKPAWSISPGINAGYNSLVRGYRGYSNLGNAGVDIYFRPPIPDARPAIWADKTVFRLSTDYFPLQVPKGNYGLTEDIYSLTGTLLYRFQERFDREFAHWIPFAGLGAGVYMDSLALDTPASGKVTGTDTFLGFNGAVGIMLPTKSKIRFIPEIRVHALRTTGNYWAVNTTFQLGMVYWVPVGLGCGCE